MGVVKKVRPDKAKMSVFLTPLLIFLACFSTSFGTDSSIPHWENLECEVGHKYLFSGITHTWQDAKLECELDGAFLLNLKDISEQNCLMRFAQTQQNIDHWYWTDAHFGDTVGVWVHAFDNSEVTWFSPKLNCGGGSQGSDDNHIHTTTSGGDAYLVSLRRSNRYLPGAWCDYPS